MGTCCGCNPPVVEVKEEDKHPYVQAFEKYKNKTEKNWDMKSHFKLLNDITPELETQKEIQELIEIFEEHYRGRDIPFYNGIFLSHIVNERYKENEIELKFNNNSWDYLGIFTNKDWTIKGNVQHNIGYENDGGKIIVNGNVGQDLGCNMKNGEIIIEGNTAGCIGAHMKDGKIIIKGYADSFMNGFMMEGGEIHLLGGYDKIDEHIIGGTIIINTPKDKIKKI